MDKRKSKSKAKMDVVSLDDYRKNKNEERRREYERVLFNRILGVYSFVEKPALQQVDVIDISNSGLKCRESAPETPLTLEQKVAFRLYFTPSSYLRVVAQVKRIIQFKEQDREGLEYGCEFDKSTKSYEVIRQLVSLINKYSETACQDQNPPMIWF